MKTTSEIIAIVNALPAPNEISDVGGTEQEYLPASSFLKLHRLDMNGNKRSECVRAEDIHYMATDLRDQSLILFMKNGKQVHVSDRFHDAFNQWKQREPVVSFKRKLYVEESFYLAVRVADILEFDISKEDGTTLLLYFAGVDRRFEVCGYFEHEVRKLFPLRRFAAFTKIVRDTNGCACAVPTDSIRDVKESYQDGVTLLLMRDQQLGRIAVYESADDVVDIIENLEAAA